MERATVRNLKLIQLITPTTPRERAVEIARSTTGFIYYVSVAGITGEHWNDTATTSPWTETVMFLYAGFVWSPTRTPGPAGAACESWRSCESVRLTARDMISGETP